MNTFNIAPVAPETQLPDPISHLLNVARTLSDKGFVEARLEDGSYYSRNKKTGETVVAVPGLIVHQRAATVEVVVAQPGSTTRELLEATSRFTQKQRAGFTGTSQPQVSVMLSE